MAREYVLQPFQAPAQTQIDYARELNEQQHAAVTAVPGPALVIAGAGSGKTRTLTYRVAYLLEQGIPADRILLLTFTNKAAREMMRRVAEVLGHDLSSLWGGTFHSIGHRILRRHADWLGYRQDFTIMDREDAKDLVKASIEDAKIDVTDTRFPKADVLADILSLAANTEQPVLAVLREHYPYFADLKEDIEKVGARYAARKQSGNVLDFDDLLVLWLRLLKEHADVAEVYQRRFQFVLVDEYQDTNRIQSELVDVLAQRSRNLMVVGDDSQSIYSWRGAHFLNILEFPKRYPEAKIYKIEVNYRSTPEILAVANAAIAPNLEQFTKELAPARKSGSKPALVVCGDADEQAAFVAQRALQLRDEGRSLNEMAVLYRSHFHALELQLELTRRNIPFSITSGIRFFEQAHIKDAAAYLKLICNPHEEISFKRIVRLLPGIGGKGAEKLWSCFAAKLANPAAGPISSFAAKAAPPMATALQGCAERVPGKAAVGWAQLCATVAQLETEPVRGKPWRMLQLVIEAGYEEYLMENFANYRSRLEDLDELVRFARRFEGLEDFLTQLALLSNLEADEDRPVAADDERMGLSTIHQAKGLEFGVVFVIMLCDGLFPSQHSLDRRQDEEEERRLFYVAITRAKHELYLSYPLVRMAAGAGGSTIQKRSRFLDALPSEMLEEWNLRAFSRWG